MLNYSMSFLDNIKNPPKLSGPVKIVLPKPTKSKGGKWKILNKQNLHGDIKKRVMEFVKADEQGKQQRDTAMQVMSSMLKSNKYNKKDQLLLIGALSERKSLPFVNRLLSKFPEENVKQGGIMYASMKNGKPASQNQSTVPLPPPPPLPKKSKSPQLPKKSKSPQLPNTKETAVNNSNNNTFYTPIKKTNVHSNTATALTTIKRLLRSQKSNEILRINLLVVGKKVKKMKYDKT